MGQIAIVATLRDGAEERARQLIERGPPFEPSARGFSRHTIFLSANEVVFVFDASEVEWRLDELVDEPPGVVQEAVDAWRPLVDGPPRIARLAYAWESGASAPPLT
jgi:hypothetical protein